MDHKIYGAKLNNVQFGTRDFDDGIVQTEEIEHRVEDEKIIGNKGQKLGGAKHGPDRELSITYVSNITSPGDFDLIGADATLTFGGKTWELFNVREARGNTTFLTFTARAEWSDDWSA